MRHRPAWIVGLGMLASVGLAADEGAETRDAHPDCGPIALATLLHLEDVPVRVEELAGRMGSDGIGHSLAQLRDEASRLGVPLTGVRLSGDPRDLDRPALIHLNRGQHGHFLVVRPVGHSGTLVQVFDAQGSPVVIDGDALYRSREWTGMALIPARGVGSRRLVAVWIATGAGVCIWLGRRRSRHRAGRPRMEVA